MYAGQLFDKDGIQRMWYGGAVNPKLSLIAGCSASSTNTTSIVFWGFRYAYGNAKSKNSDACVHNWPYNIPMEAYPSFLMLK